MAVGIFHSNLSDSNSESFSLSNQGYVSRFEYVQFLVL